MVCVCVAEDVERAGAVQTAVVDDCVVTDVAIGVAVAENA